MGLAVDADVDTLHEADIGIEGVRGGHSALRPHARPADSRDAHVSAEVGDDRLLFVVTKLRSR